MSAEFDIIKRFFKRDMTEHDTVVLGVGDDAAILAPTAAAELVVTLDTMVEGVHFADNEDPYDVGYKLVAVNLSDLAAMGAEPRWATMAMTLAEIDELWLESFADGLFFMMDEHNVALVGGDTTSGALTVSMQMAGELAGGTALRRDGAQAGDNIYVSGTLGDAALGLRVREGSVQLEELDEVFVEMRLCRPEPRLALGRALRGIANSCIDVSDGLLADLGHILEASHVGADIELKNIPLSEVTAAHLHGEWELALASGDDYELCFTAAADRHAAIMRAAQVSDTRVTHIGQVVEGSSCRCLLDDGSEYICQHTGYEHFVEEQA
jgi:thiamine-monophosphate kinase